MSEFKIKDTFEIQVGGKTVKVEYDGVSYGNIVIHFSFHGKNISSTGYRSHFLFTEDFISMKYSNYAEGIPSGQNLRSGHCRPAFQRTKSGNG